MSDPTIPDPDAEIAELRAQLAAARAESAAAVEAQLEPSVAEVTITPTHQRGPLRINYPEPDGTARYFVLSGHVPADVIRAIDSVPRPRGNVGVLKQEYEEATGLAATASFLETVVPEDFRRVLDLTDVPAVYQAWSRHTGLGKGLNSAGS